MFCKPIISVKNLSKCYQLYDQPADRLKQFLWRGKRQYFREFWALRDVSFDVMPGEVLGIIGRNGAGKSTLLQLLCGTLTPTSGSVEVNGRVAALLELGAGFNPEFTGRENVYLSAAILGLSDAEIADRFESIVAFSGISDFIDQPVKTYSSGMYVRLAFSVATSVDPDILIIDEALSVGDGAFARKSFERIMSMKDNGKTILFCSHSMYHIESLCQNAIWLDSGSIRLAGDKSRTTYNYNNFLTSNSKENTTENSLSHAIENQITSNDENIFISGKIIAVHGKCDAQYGRSLIAKSKISNVSIVIEFFIHKKLPRPSVALAIDNFSGLTITSLITNTKENIFIDKNGKGIATVVFPEIPLMKGDYKISAFLACEKGLHVYDSAQECVILEITQEDNTQGITHIPHIWNTVHSDESIS